MKWPLFSWGILLCSRSSSSPPRFSSRGMVTIFTAMTGSVSSLSCTQTKHVGNRLFSTTFLERDRFFVVAHLGALLACLGGDQELGSVSAARAFGFLTLHRKEGGK